MSSRRVILNADDLGYDPEVSRGIVEAMTQGVVSSTTLMVNTPHSEHAAKLARGLPGRVGLHLNLARWSAVSDPSHTFDEGSVERLSVEWVERETLAQLHRLRALLGVDATHLDVHKHLHQRRTVLDGVVRAARARGLPVRSPDGAVREVLRREGIATNDLMLGDAGATAYWTREVFEQTVKALPTVGVVELMCHPGYPPSQVKSGYGAQRQVELATFTAPRARAVLKEAGVTFEAWALGR